MIPRQKHIGIFEPNHKGHRFKYVQYLVSATRVESEKVTLITTEEAISSDHFNLHLEPFKTHFDIQLIDPKKLNRPDYYAQLLGTDLMIYPSADGYAWKSLWLRGWPADGNLHALIMRPSGQSARLIPRQTTTLLKTILDKLCNGRKNVTTFRLASAVAPEGKDGFTVPDPISFDPDPESLKSLLGEDLYQKRLKWIGALGTLDDRKNVPVILKAINELQTFVDIGIVLAGRIAPNIKPEMEELLEQIRKKGIPIVVIDRILSDGELDALIEMCHLVVMAHSNEGPSGIFGKAVEAGTYIVAAGAQTLKDDCNHVPHLGNWTRIRPDTIAQLITATLQRETPKAIHLETERVFSNRLLGIN